MRFVHAFYGVGMMVAVGVGCGESDKGPSTPRATGGSSGKGGSGGTAGTGTGGKGASGGRAGSGGSAGTEAAGSGGTAGASAGRGGSPGKGGSGGRAGAGGSSSGSPPGGEGGSDGGEAGSGEGGAGGAPDEVSVFYADFEGPDPAGMTFGDGVKTPTQGYASLGSPGNTFATTFLRSPTGNSITVTITGLPAHTSLSLAMLFAAIDSLDGTGTFPAGDFFRITVDGQEIFRESFANALESQIQSYVPPPGAELARRVDLGFQGPGGYYTDSAYDFGKDARFSDISHSASSVVLVFTLEGDGVQSLDDESWAIDNLRVTVR